MSLLRLKKIKKYYPIGKEKFYAVKGIDITFEAGELVSIMGESGSGKSTLMNLIGALDTQYEGEIYVNDLALHNFNEKQRDTYRKNTIGFIFQSFNLIPHLTVLDNVAIAMTIANVNYQEKITKAKELLTEVGLEAHMKKRPNQLSGGQKQRVAIARALMNDPDIILADEPTGALDKETTEQVLDIIKNIARKGKLVIMVTHSQRVADISDRIVEMSDGLIIKDVITKEEHTNPLNVLPKEFKKRNLSFVSAVKLALQNMKAKLGRNILVAIGGSIGITSVILMLSIGDGVIAYLNDKMGMATNPYVVEVNQAEDLSALPPEASAMGPIPSALPKPFSVAQQEELCQLEYVVTCEQGASLTTIGANFIRFNDLQANVSMLDTMAPTMTDANLSAGAFPNEQEILLGTSFNKEFNQDMIGQVVTLQLFVDGKIIEEDFTVSGLYTFGEGLDDLPMAQMGMAFINYSDLEQLYTSNDVTLEPTIMYLLSDDTTHTPLIKEEITNLGYAGSSEEFMSSMFTEMISLVSVVLAGISGISLFVSAIMILVVLYISVVERTREIGVLKAIGARRKDIKRIFVSEAFLLGLFSGLVAILTSSVVAVVANQISMSMADTTIILLNPTNLLVGCSVSIVISMIAGLFPAAKAAKLDPVESLRHE